MAESVLEGTNGQRKVRHMARSKPSARDALRKLLEQREELDAREARLREEAAAELGKLLVECGAETIEPAQLRRLDRLCAAFDEQLAEFGGRFLAEPGFTGIELFALFEQLPERIPSARFGSGHVSYLSLAVGPLQNRFCHCRGV